jgi:thiol-disulfide isomerase/thioredoxin
MKIRKTLIFTSFFFNLLIFGGVLYFIFNSSFSANFENVSVSENVKNFDSINNANMVKIIEISPNELNFKIDKLSKDKSCVVIFWASWCKYCPELIKIIDKIKHENDFDFNLILVSIDKPNQNGKKSLLKKIAYLNLKREQYITNQNDFSDISNSKVIYKYLKDKTAFDKNPGFPHIQIFKRSKILYENTGYDPVYGLSKFLNYLKK